MPRDNDTCWEMCSRDLFNDASYRLIHSTSKQLTGWCSYRPDYALGLYSLGFPFESGEEHWILRVKVVCDCGEFFQANPAMVPPLGDDHFLPDPSQFTNHLTCQRHIVPNTDKVIQEATTKCRACWKVMFGYVMEWLWGNAMKSV